MSSSKDEYRQYYSRRHGPESDVKDCNEYASKTVEYKEIDSASCPFRDGLCSNLTVDFDTGYVDAMAIGLNTPQTYKFRRRATCTQLSTSLYRRNST